MVAADSPGPAQLILIRTPPPTQSDYHLLEQATPESVPTSGATVSSVACWTRGGELLAWPLHWLAQRSAWGQTELIEPNSDPQPGSDILQVISGKETKLKGTKKDPNCGFCQNHGIKILRKGSYVGPYVARPSSSTQPTDLLTN